MTDDASKAMDAALQARAATHAITDGPTSQLQEVPRPFSKTPPELRIMIAKEVMQNWYNSIIVRNRSGERLLDILLLLFSRSLCYPWES